MACSVPTVLRAANSTHIYPLSDAMPGLSYPFVYECSGCGNETTVTREDARGLYPDPDSLNAAEVVLEQRGWMHGGFDRSIFCPECIGGTSALEG